MAGRAMCAGGSGALFAPGTRRGSDADGSAGATASCGASATGGASCPGGALGSADSASFPSLRCLVIGIVEHGTYVLAEGLWQP